MTPDQRTQESKSKMGWYSLSYESLTVAQTYIAQMIPLRTRRYHTAPSCIQQFTIGNKLSDQ